MFTVSDPPVLQFWSLQFEYWSVFVIWDLQFVTYAIARQEKRLPLLYG
jgi:hypothetical protein